MNYIIKRMKCYPSGNINWNGNLYISMSMNNRVFQHANLLRLVLDDITEKTKQFTIIVGDYLHRYNEQIFNGFNEHEATNSALEKGFKIVELFNNVAQEYKSIANYELRHSHDFITHAAYYEKMKRFISLYGHHSHFSHLTDYTVDVFLRRQNEIRIDYKKARELCRQYLFEELVIFEILAEEGYKVNIYPGNQLPIIKSIVTGELKGVSESLEHIQAVEIKFRPK